MACWQCGVKPLSEPVLLLCLYGNCVKWPWTTRSCGPVPTQDKAQQNVNNGNNSGCEQRVIDGFVQDCSNRSANALELLQSCTKLSSRCCRAEGAFLVMTGLMTVLFYNGNPWAPNDGLCIETDPICYAQLAISSSRLASFLLKGK